jgi:hypothetical protein
VLLECDHNDGKDKWKMQLTISAGLNLWPYRDGCDWIPAIQLFGVAV